MKAAIIIAAIITAALTPATATASDDVVARVWSTYENTRLVLESDERLPYAVSDSANPPRLILDINRRGISPQIVNTLEQPNESYLSGIEAQAAEGEQHLRIYFNLSDIVNYRIHRLKPINRYRHRLVIDITPQQPAEDPLLALLQSLESEEAETGSERFVVLIDPGHGGEDPGAVSPNNNYEKNVVLQISRLLADAVNRYPNMRAVLTRSDDRFIPLFDRVKIAHKLDADAFVSVHADSVKNRKARGSSVFILSKKGASTKRARQLAAQENLSDLIGGQPTAAADPLIEATLRQFSQDGKERASRLMARFILDELKRINKLHGGDAVQSAGFAVLKSPSIPSVLVETAFISNPQEEKKLTNKKFQATMAESIARAIDDYRKEHHTE